MSVFSLARTASILSTHPSRSHTLLQLMPDEILRMLLAAQRELREVALCLMRRERSRESAGEEGGPRRCAPQRRKSSACLSQPNPSCSLSLLPPHSFLFSSSLTPRGPEEQGAWPQARQLPRPPALL